MTKKIIFITASFLAVVLAFSSCKQKGEEAPIKSDEDSVTVKFSFEKAEEQISLANAAKPNASKDTFFQIVQNPDVKAASFDGNSDLDVNFEEKTDKTLKIKTTGKVTVNSEVSSVVLAGCSDFTSNAKIGTLIVDGSDIESDINGETENIYVEGKNAVVNIKSENTKNVYVRNSTALIKNHTEKAIDVILANGTKVTVEANKTYRLSDNTILNGVR